MEKYILDFAKLPLRKGTVTILDLSGYKAILKIHNYLNMYGNQKMKIRFLLLKGEFLKRYMLNQDLIIVSCV